MKHLSGAVLAASLALSPVLAQAASPQAPALPAQLYGAVAPLANIILFTSSGTYYPSPGVKTIQMLGCGAGGAGGSGAVQNNTTASSGGAAGGSAYCNWPGVWFDPADIGTSATITVPTAPAGGVAVTATVTTPTNGNPGAAGSNLTVVNAASTQLMLLAPGGPGSGGQASATTSGGGGGGGNVSGGGAGSAGAGGSGGNAYLVIREFF